MFPPNNTNCSGDLTMHTPSFRLSVLAAAVAASLLPGTARAQLELEEIIVTAQKRAESLQDVPISLTAIQGDQIKAAGVQDMTKIAQYVPNLHIDVAAINTNIYMRGVGSGNNQGFEQSVPYCTLLVELDEMPRLLLAGYLPGEGEELSIGAPVEVFFEDIEGSDLKLPNFRLVK